MPKLTAQEKKKLAKTLNWRGNVKRKTINRNTYSKRLNRTRKNRNNTTLRLRRRFINEDEGLTLLRLKRAVLFFRALERLHDEKTRNIKDKLCDKLPYIEGKIGTFNSFNKPIMGVKPGCNVYFSSYTQSLKSVYQEIMHIYEQFAENPINVTQQRLIDIEDKYSELARDLYKIINDILKPKNNNNNINKKNRISFNDFKNILEEIAKEEPVSIPTAVKMEEENKNNNHNNHNNHNNNENNYGKLQQNFEVDMLEELFKRSGI